MSWFATRSCAGWHRWLRRSRGVSVERLDLRVAHDVDHVEVDQSVHEPSNKLGAYACTLGVPENFRKKDALGEHPVGERVDESDDGSGVVAGDDDVSAVLEKSEMLVRIGRSGPTFKEPAAEITLRRGSTADSEYETIKWDAPV